MTSLPGPAACMTMSGRPTRRFAFEAFLPPDKQERKAVLSELKEETRTVILYEAPHRLLRTLKELCEVFGKDRPLTICKELTKRHEKAMLTTFKEAVDFYEEQEPRVNMCWSWRARAGKRLSGRTGTVGTDEYCRPR